MVNSMRKRMAGNLDSCPLRELQPLRWPRNWILHVTHCARCPVRAHPSLVFFLIQLQHHIFFGEHVDSAQKGHAVQKVVLSFITSMCGAGCARCSCQDDELGRGVLASRKAGMGLKERHTWSALHGSCCSPGQCHCASAQTPLAAEDKRIWPAVTLPPRHLPLGEAG